MNTTSGTARLEVRDIVKSFGANRALKGVNLTVGDGEVVGLIGENGAGKSTILNIVSGVLPYDSGTITLDGTEIAPKTYQEANRLGIFRVFQEANLIDKLAVYENTFFGWEKLFTSRGFLNRGALIRATDEALDEAGIDGIDARTPTGSLSPGQKQSLDIARVIALARTLEIERPVVLFDEPTTALDHEHEDNFLRLLQRLRGQAAVVFVSHRLPEILATTDRVTVFKDGESIAERDTTGADETQLHRLMVGRVRTENYYRAGAQTIVDAGQRPRLVVRDLAGADVLREATFEVLPGEIFGLAGTEGSGNASSARSSQVRWPAPRGPSRSTAAPSTAASPRMSRPASPTSHRTAPRRASSPPRRSSTTSNSPPCTTDSPHAGSDCGRSGEPARSRRST